MREKCLRRGPSIYTPLPGQLSWEQEHRTTRKRPVWHFLVSATRTVYPSPETEEGECHYQSRMNFTTPSVNMEPEIRGMWGNPSQSEILISRSVIDLIKYLLDHSQSRSTLTYVVLLFVLGVRPGSSSNIETSGLPIFCIYVCVRTWHMYIHTYWNIHAYLYWNFNTTSHYPYQTLTEPRRRESNVTPVDTLFLCLLEDWNFGSVCLTRLSTIGRQTKKQQKVYTTSGHFGSQTVETSGFRVQVSRSSSPLLPLWPRRDVGKNYNPLEKSNDLERVNHWMGHLHDKTEDRKSGLIKPRGYHQHDPVRFSYPTIEVLTVLVV